MSCFIFRGFLPHQPGSRGQRAPPGIQVSGNAFVTAQYDFSALGNQFVTKQSGFYGSGNCIVQ